MFNLLTDAWLPVRRLRSGADVIRPAQLVVALDDDPVIALDWPRPDFRVASLELLIGLLATFCPPARPRCLDQSVETPPAPEALDAAFAPFAHAFALDGDGPRFLQDFDELVADPEPIERLLIEAPGDSTSDDNTDLLVRRGRVNPSWPRLPRLSRSSLCNPGRPRVAAGNRTGLRGGGPLITLVLPQTARSLWHVLWANVPCGRAADLRRTTARLSVARAHPHLRGRAGGDAAERASAAMLVGHAAPHPAGFFAGGPARAMRADWHAGHGAGDRLAATATWRQVRHLGRRASADADPPTETRNPGAAGTCAARWHRVSPLARARARQARTGCASRRLPSPIGGATATATQTTAARATGPVCSPLVMT